MRRLCLVLSLPVFLIGQSVWAPFSIIVISFAALYAISREIYESFRDDRESLVFSNIWNTVSDDAIWYVVGALIFLPILGWIQLVFPDSHVVCLDLSFDCCE